MAGHHGVKASEGSGELGFVVQPELVGVFEVGRLVSGRLHRVTSRGPDDRRAGEARAR